MRTATRTWKLTTLALTFVLCGTALSGGERATPSEVIAKVREAAALLDTRGDAALAVLRDPGSRFTWKDSYVFVVDCSADRVLSNPRFPEREGGDIKQHGDYAGKPYGKKLCEVAARPDGGWIEYVWLRPGTKTPSRKISFVISAGNGAYQVGSGVYDETLGLVELERLVRP